MAQKQLRWEFQNLVSDRKITLLIPAAEAPLARVMLLSRLVAIAVLLFGAGFWYLSEQVQPGQLDRFRLGHFLLLALTYSLFFVIFAVLEFGGKFSTPVSMEVAAVFSLPLLVLHVSRILNLWFALTRVVPLMIFTLGMVINRVYGGTLRDDVFIGAAIFVIAYVTLTYQSWMMRREQYAHQKTAALAARRRTLIAGITSGIGAQMAELSATEAQAAEYLKAAPQEQAPGVSARLEQMREPLGSLAKEYQELVKRLSSLSDEGEQGYDEIERKAGAFRDRLEPFLIQLQIELTSVRASIKSHRTPRRDGDIHCVACGQTVPNTPFCQECGSAQAAVVSCPECGEQQIIPLHLIDKEQQSRTLFCLHCGSRLSALSQSERQKKGQ